MAAQLHFAEHALALHLLLKHSERLVDIVVANQYLHAAFLLIERFDSSAVKPLGASDARL
jgi:hypothetical protein